MKDKSVFETYVLFFCHFFRYDADAFVFVVFVSFVTILRRAFQYVGGAFTGSIFGIGARREACRMALNDRMRLCVWPFLSMNKIVENIKCMS